MKAFNQRNIRKFFRVDPSLISVDGKIKCFLMMSEKNLVIIGDHNACLYAANWKSEVVLASLKIKDSNDKLKAEDNFIFDERLLNNTEVDHSLQILSISLYSSIDSIILVQLRSGEILSVQLVHNSETWELIVIDKFQMGVESFTQIAAEFPRIWISQDEHATVACLNLSASGMFVKDSKIKLSLNTKVQPIDDKLGVVSSLKILSANTVILGLECSSIFIVSINLPSKRPEISDQHNEIKIGSTKNSKFSSMVISLCDSTLQNEPNISLSDNCSEITVHDYIRHCNDFQNILSIATLELSKELVRIYIGFYSSNIIQIDYDSNNKKFIDDSKQIILGCCSDLKPGIPTLSAYFNYENSQLVLATGGYDFRVRIYTANKSQDPEMKLIKPSEHQILHNSIINKVQIHESNQDLFLVVCGEDYILRIYQQI